MGGSRVAVSCEPDGSPTQPPSVQDVYSHWRDRFHPRARKTLPKKDRAYKAIRTQISAGMTLDEAREAIDGNHASEFHVRNSQHALSLIFRDSDHVEKFREIMHKHSRGASVEFLSDREKRNRAVLQRFAQRHGVNGDGKP